MNNRQIDLDAVYAKHFFDTLGRGGSEAQAEATAKRAVENAERAIRNRTLAVRRRLLAANGFSTV